MVILLHRLYYNSKLAVFYNVKELLLNNGSNKFMEQFLLVCRKFVKFHVNLFQ